MAVNFSKIRWYIKIWWQSAVVNFSVLSASRIDFLTFVGGKLLRMFFFLILVLSIFAKTESLVGYDRGQVLMFFAVMNFIDIILQMFWFRGMTDLSRLLQRGDFDFVLVKPISPLFWTCFRFFDFFDLTTIPFAIYILWYAWSNLQQSISAGQVILGLILLALGLILAFAVNLALVSLSFWTTELENAWWLYRDLAYVSRFPPEILPIAARVIFTFIVPMLVIVTFPTKGLLGILSWPMIVWAVVCTAIFLKLALKIWNLALSRYTSASS